LNIIKGQRDKSTSGTSGKDIYPRGSEGYISFFIYLPNTENINNIKRKELKLSAELLISIIIRITQKMEKLSQSEL